MKIDDAVGAIPLKLGAGIWGTLAVGLYGDLEILGTGLTRIEQISVQLLGIGVTAVWAFGLTYIILKLVNSFHRLRVSAEHEDIGLNLSEHGEVEDMEAVHLPPGVALTADGTIKSNTEPRQFEKDLLKA